MSDRLDKVADDVGELKRWAERHEKRHSDDSGMLRLVLQRGEQSMQHLEKHVSNHHGRATTIKQGGIMTAALSLLYVVVELLRRLVF